MTDDEASTIRDRIERCALIKADSLNHTYNQHFLAANFYRWLNRFLDTVLFATSLLLVSQALRTVWPAWTTFAIPGVMAVISGVPGRIRGLQETVISIVRYCRRLAARRMPCRGP